MPAGGEPAPLTCSPQLSEPNSAAMLFPARLERMDDSVSHAPATPIGLDRLTLIGRRWQWNWAA